MKRAFPSLVAAALVLGAVSPEASARRRSAPKETTTAVSPDKAVRLTQWRDGSWLLERVGDDQPIARGVAAPASRAVVASSGRSFALIGRWGEGDQELQLFVDGSLIRAVGTRNELFDADVESRLPSRGMKGPTTWSGDAWFDPASMTFCVQVLDRAHWERGILRYPELHWPATAAGEQPPTVLAFDLADGRSVDPPVTAMLTGAVDLSRREFLWHGRAVVERGAGSLATLRSLVEGFETDEGVRVAAALLVSSADPGDEPSRSVLDDTLRGACDPARRFVVRNAARWLHDGVPLTLASIQGADDDCGPTARVALGDAFYDDPDRVGGATRWWASRRTKRRPTDRDRVHILIEALRAVRPHSIGLPAERPDIHVAWVPSPTLVELLEAAQASPDEELRDAATQTLEALVRRR